MRGIVAAAVSAAALIAAIAPIEAMAKKPREVWSVTRVTDPITGDHSCVVTAYDTVLGMKFSRFGFLYPVVENNSKLGLLVGISSGGQFRVPTGDILWRVDDKPYRELKAADNPATSTASYVAPYKTGNADTDKRIADAIAQSSTMVASITATSTMASGDRAREMLAEMVAGRSLIYRAATAAPAYGLPSSATVSVGQYTEQGHVPIFLDDSFRRGLATCGIASPPA